LRVLCNSFGKKAKQFTVSDFWRSWRPIMLFQKIVVLVLGLAAFTEAISVREEARLLRRQNRNFGGNGSTANNANKNGGNTGNNNAASSSKASAATATCLNAKAIQTGSQSDGQNPPVSGQAASAT
jgi:hypothetical protein